MTNQNVDLDFLFAVSRSPRVAEGDYTRLHLRLGQEWRKVFGDASEYSIVFDSVRLPQAGTRAAARVLLLTTHSRRFGGWLKSHIRNAVVHGVERSDILSFDDRVIHFFEAKRVPSDQLHSSSKRLYQRLQESLKGDLERSFDRKQDAEIAFSHFLSWVAAPPEAEAFPADSNASDFAAFAEWLARQRSAGVSSVSDLLDVWSDELNRRRCELIDKEIDFHLSEDEKAELDDLQERMLRHRKRVAPLPMAATDRLYEELNSRTSTRE
ncbi:MAG: hypothetical protein K2Y37_23795 [Pirellulales bacterium]|nr:hypothetical protein [Pirellulales bacterium]